MKLVRFGPAGQEKPGIVAPDGTLRDLSGLVADIDGDALSPDGLLWLPPVMQEASDPVGV